VDGEPEAGGKHRGSENLMPPWKPGQSGNPSGRRKGGVNITSQLKKRLIEKPHELKKILDSWIGAASLGDEKCMAAVRELVLRVDGPPEADRSDEQPAKLVNVQLPQEFLDVKEIKRENEELRKRLEELEKKAEG